MWELATAGTKPAACPQEAASHAGRGGSGSKGAGRLFGAARTRQEAPQGDEAAALEEEAKAQRQIRLLITGGL